MDQDANDILFTNIFVPTGTIELKNENNKEEFKKYYIESEKKEIEMKQVVIPKQKKHISTCVNIDSRDRDKIVYPLASDFIIYLNKTYTNVQSIKLVSIEFPNTDAVINSLNNKIYWINQQDVLNDNIDQITGTYPVYYAILRVGNYTASTLQKEITNEMNMVKRFDQSFHYFVIDLDLDTDVVTFISLILENLPNNPITTTVNTGIITVNAPNHNYKTGDNIYFLNVSTVAGIPGSTINGFQLITVINANTFQISVNVNANDTVSGGGNTVSAGEQSPFQLLFGEKMDTVCQNIGYSNEDSSDLINVDIKSVQNFYQVVITTSAILPFDSTGFNTIGESGILVNSGATTNNISIDGSNLISGVQSIMSVLLNIPGNLDESIYINQTDNNNGLGDVVNGMYPPNYGLLQIGSTNNQIVFANTFSIVNNEYQGWWIKIISGNASGNVRMITSYNNYIATLSSPLIGLLLTGVDAFYLYQPSLFSFNNINYNIVSIVGYINCINVTFNTIHNYSPSDIGKNITLNGTDTTPSYDGTFVINGVPNGYSVVLSGSLFSGSNISPINGTSPQYNCVESYIYEIESVIPGSSYTVINCMTEHDLSIGDIIKIVGLTSIPSIGNGIFFVYSIPSDKTFTIEFTCKSVESVSITNSFIGTNKFKLTMPSHGFNTITNLTGISGIVTVTTLLPHNLENNEITRIMQTGTVVDNSSFMVTVQSFDTFTFTTSHHSNFSSSSGILGMSNTFRLYNCPMINTIVPELINNVKLEIVKIIDENSFIFTIYQAFSSANQQTGTDIYISSFRNGYKGTQTNTKNGILNRPINLAGENYALLCCPQLSNMVTTSPVKNVFAKIILDQSPGCISFSFLNNPKTFDQIPLANLNEIEFSVLNYDTTPYFFNDLDYSFTLEIVEIVDTREDFNISSRRQI